MNYQEAYGFDDLVDLVNTQAKQIAGLKKALEILARKEEYPSDLETYWKMGVPDIEKNLLLATNVRIARKALKEFCEEK